MAAGAVTTTQQGPFARIRPHLRSYLPSGRELPEAVWQRRHLGVTVLLWLHVPGVFLFGLIVGRGLSHSLSEAMLVAIPAAIASWSVPSRTVRSVAASLGLMVASAVITHLSGGYIEAHFHFFVMVGVIALYQSWVPFLVAVGFVVVHHAVMGVLDPTAVFNHPAGQQQPLVWAGIHGAFVLAASGVSLTAWRLVEDQGLHDYLTSLPNRTLFGDRVTQALAASSRSGQSIAILFMDLDGFKQVNDSLGHAAGDELLKVVGGRLAGSIRTMDSVARYGGDEFAVMLVDIPSVDAVVPMVERIQAALSVPVEIHDQEVRPQASIGIALSRPSDSPDSLIRNADLAMYMAKSRGRGQLEFFEPAMRIDLVERVRLRQDLQVAVDTGTIMVAYQPIVDLETRRVVGAEALARWTHPERGNVPPDAFIPIAEETDLIFRLGRQVLAEACRRWAEWRRDGLVPEHFAISVNLSARQLRDPGLPAFVAETKLAHGLQPNNLILEITESVLLEDSEFVKTQLEELRREGTRLALDDFGTGYSSLNYLRNFPIDIIKIDRSFVRELQTGAANSAVVRAITSLSQSMDLRTVAEGVEEVGQIDELLRLGCHYAQGYHFARPLDAEAFVAFARSAGTEADDWLTTA
jgi:diguanylate cyclase (GGDEF)-like protein